MSTHTCVPLQAEQVRQGAPGAPQKLQGLLREAVAGGGGPPTPQQAAADQDYLQQALEQQEAGRNHVGAACYGALMTALQVGGAEEGAGGNDRRLCRVVHAMQHT
jgi:hypothetical protein